MLKYLLCARHCAKHYLCIISFTLHTALTAECCYSHVIDGKTEPQKGKITCTCAHTHTHNHTVSKGHCRDLNLVCLIQRLRLLGHCAINNCLSHLPGKVVTLSSQAFMPGTGPPHHTCQARTHTGTLPSLSTFTCSAGNGDAISTSSQHGTESWHLSCWMLKAKSL